MTPFQSFLVQSVSGGTHDGAQWHYHYDGNGNVTELTNISGNTVATYRYTAFGDTWQSSGTAAQANHYRFSTKPIDGEVVSAASNAFSSGLYYYGYRFYDPALGRWINRDPIGERGGLNLYGFVENDPVRKWDILGNTTCNKDTLRKTREVTSGALLNQRNCGNSSYTQTVTFSVGLFGIGGSRSTSVTIKPCTRMKVTATYKERCEVFRYQVHGHHIFSKYYWTYDSFVGFNPVESKADCS